MSTTAATGTMTADDLLHLPEDGYRYELVRGELRKMSPSGHEHGRIAMRLAVRLAQHVEEHDLGAVYAAETGFFLATDPDLVRAPDAAFVRRERVEQARRRHGFWQGAPDLAAEVISPSDTYGEVDEKVCDWLDAGTRLVVVVDPRTGTVTPYRSRTEIRMLTGDDVLDGGDVVPGWKLPVRDLFR